jgi:hypothetical protein
MEEVKIRKIEERLLVGANKADHGQPKDQPQVLYPPAPTHQRPAG